MTKCKFVLMFLLSIELYFYLSVIAGLLWSLRQIFMYVYYLRLKIGEQPNHLTPDELLENATWFLTLFFGFSKDGRLVFRDDLPDTQFDYHDADTKKVAEVTLQYQFPLSYIKSLLILEIPTLLFLIYKQYLGVQCIKGKLKSVTYLNRYLGLSFAYALTSIIVYC